MTRYRLCSHVEEFHCPECGRPVYCREHAVEHEGDCYCSRHCAEDAIDEAETAIGKAPRAQVQTSRTAQPSLF